MRIVDNEVPFLERAVSVVLMLAAVAVAAAAGWSLLARVYAPIAAVLP